MDFLGIGILELMLIFLIALIVLGPQDMVKVGRGFGRFLRRTIFSPTWLNIQRNIRNLPYQLMREAGIEDMEKELKQVKTKIDQDLRTIHTDMSKDAQSLQSDLNQVNIPGAAQQYSRELQQASQVPSEWVSPPSDSQAENPLPTPSGSGAASE